MRKTKNKGSVLAFTLSVLGLVLVIALGISIASVLEIKSSSTTDKSNQAFQIADSGVNIILKKIKDLVQTNPSATMADLGGCSNGTINIAPGIAGGSVIMNFYKDENSTIPAACTDLLSSLKKVKSVGTFSGATRAVEVAVAASCDCPKILCSKVDNSTGCNLSYVDQEKFYELKMYKDDKDPDDADTYNVWTSPSRAIIYDKGNGVGLIKFNNAAGYSWRIRKPGSGAASKLQFLDPATGLWTTAGTGRIWSLWEISY